jgi:hypothetical protein
LHGHGFQIHVAAPIGEDGIARRHRKTSPTADGADQALGQIVGEMDMLRRGSRYLERQYGDRRPVLEAFAPDGGRSGQRSNLVLRVRIAGGDQPVGAHRASDVLQPLQAQIYELVASTIHRLHGRVGEDDVAGRTSPSSRPAMLTPSP